MLHELERNEIVELAKKRGGEIEQQNNAGGLLHKVDMRLLDQQTGAGAREFQHDLEIRPEYEIEPQNNGHDLPHGMDQSRWGRV